MLKRQKSQADLRQSTMDVEDKKNLPGIIEDGEEEAKRTRVEADDIDMVTQEEEEEEERKKVMKTDGSRMPKVANLTVVCEGDVNRVPLTLSRDGNKAWARRRDPPHQLQFATMESSGNVSWENTKHEINLGHQGLTRCGALHDYFVMQRHHDGMVVFTDGGDFVEQMYLLWDRENHAITLMREHEYQACLRKSTDYAVCTTMACVGRGLGFVAVVEDYGLIYVNVAPFVYLPFTLVVVDDSCPNNIISSLSVDANQLGYCIGNGEDEYTRTLVVCNLLEVASKAHLRIPNMDAIMNNDEDEQIWQVALSQDTAVVVTTERCLWVTLKGRRWLSSATKGVIASCISPLTRNIAFLTVLGDCFIVHADCDRIPQRLEEGTHIQPFYTSHTRDGCVAWGTDGSKAFEVVRIIKCGGEIHQVTKGFIL